jgi:hypothetical protein
MINIKIPTIEEIFNEYHRETMFASKGIYPKPIKNFGKVIDDTNRELLLRYQKFIKSNFDSVNWKLYIKACAVYFKRRFDLKILGSLKGNKIYRDYLRYHELNPCKTNEEIKNEIISSIVFLKDIFENSKINFKEYVSDRSSPIPMLLKHIYAGSISTYFYACLDNSKIYRMMIDIPDDIFYELFNCSRNEFIDCTILSKRDKIIRIAILKDIINKINEKFNIF